jgi:hypothetical protein
MESKRTTAQTLLKNYGTEGKLKKFILACVLLLTAMPLCAYFDWESFKTADFTIFFQKGYEGRALRMLTDLEYYKHIPQEVVGNVIGSVPIMLEDWGQYDNGLTDPVFYKINVMNYESNDADWLGLVSIHEYTHMVHLTQTGGIPSAFVFLFGNEFSSQILTPDWAIEGIAVYNESKLSKYMGRLSDGGFDRYMLMRGSENTLPNLLESVYTPFGMPGGDAVYIYGSEFINFLSNQYGEDKLKKYYASYSSSALSWLSPLFPWAGIDRTFSEVYGSGTEELWGKWLKSVKDSSKDYSQEGTRLTKHGWQSTWPVFHDGKVYYVKNAGYKTGAFMEYYTNDIMEYDPKTSASRSIASATSQFMAPPCFYGKKIYYTVSEIKQGYANESNMSGGIYSVLYEKDLTTGDERELFSDAIRGFCVEDDGRILYSIDDTYSVGSHLMRFDPSDGSKKMLMETPYLIFNLACGGGMIAAEAKKEGKNSSIYLLDIGKKTLEPVADTPYYETNPEIYGGKIFFQANYGKRYGVYCYDPADKKYYSLTKNGTAMYPAYDTESGTLYFTGSNTDGYDIYSEKAGFTPAQLPADKDDYVLPPLLDGSKYTTGSYLDNLAALYPKVRVPLLFFDEYNNPVGGLELMGEDVMGDFSYDLAAAYDPGLKKAAWTLQASSLVASPLELVINAGSEYNGEFSPMLVIPFYESLRPGLSLLYATIDYDLYDISVNPGRLSRVMPAVGASFTWPLTLFSVKLSKVIEPENGSVSGRGFILGADITQYCGQTKFNINSDYYYDPDFSGNLLTAIRGYANALTGNCGSTISIDITRPLVKVRNGLWNPVNFYIEDICGGVFADSEFTADKTQASFGVEITAETKFLFYLSGPLILRFSYNRERDFMTTVTFGNLKLPF